MILNFLCLLTLIRVKRIYLPKTYACIAALFSSPVIEEEQATFFYVIFGPSAFLLPNKEYKLGNWLRQVRKAQNCKQKITAIRPDNLPMTSIHHGDRTSSLGGEISNNILFICNYLTSLSFYFVRELKGFWRGQPLQRDGDHVTITVATRTSLSKIKPYGKIIISNIIRSSKSRNPGILWLILYRWTRIDTEVSKIDGL